MDCSQVGRAQAVRRRPYTRSSGPETFCVSRRWSFPSAARPKWRPSRRRPRSTYRRTTVPPRVPPLLHRPAQEGPLMSLTGTTIILAFSALGAAPEIAHITEPACNGEVIVITGEGLDPAATRVRALYLGPTARRYSPMANRDDPSALVDQVDHRPPVPEAPPKGAMDCPVLGGSATSRCSCDTARQPGFAFQPRQPCGSATTTGGVGPMSSTGHSETRFGYGTSIRAASFHTISG